MNASLTPNETTIQKVKLLIDGEWVESQTTEWHDIVNPATQQVLAKVPFATAAEVDAAVGHLDDQTARAEPRDQRAMNAATATKSAPSAMANPCPSSPTR